MAHKKIYHSFEDLLERNCSLFKFVEKHVPLGLLRAVWNARQGEMDIRDERIRALEEETGVREDHREVLERELAERKRMVREREKSMGELGERISSLQAELESRALDGERMQGEAVEKLAEERDSWRDSLGRLEKTLAEKRRQLGERVRLCQKLERELESERAYMRTQKALNEQMSAELSRLTPARQDSGGRGYYYDNSG